MQNIPISITALSQEQLTATQTAGGPDLVKQVPNMTFTKTNFSGYSIQIRGIGTQAISVTTDPAVAVAFNDIPFIRNHFFEQEFYDVGQVEVLRGPQGTLYGRNATAGVVNLISAKPTDQFEAMASADIGNYSNRRFEGMIKFPSSTTGSICASPANGPSGRAIRSMSSTDQPHRWPRSVVRPRDDRLQAVREIADLSRLGAFLRRRRPHAHGQAALQDRSRSHDSRWQCRSVDYGNGRALQIPKITCKSGLLRRRRFIRQMHLKCRTGLRFPIMSQSGEFAMRPSSNTFDPYASTTQSRNLRVIESALNPSIRRRTIPLKFNADYTITPR